MKNMGLSLPRQSLVSGHMKRKDGIHQEILVARDRYEKGYIKMIFSTNAYGQQPKEFRDFVPEEGAKNGIFGDMKMKKN